MVKPSEEGGLKEARHAENNIIISAYTLCNIFSLQPKKMSEECKVVCGMSDAHLSKICIHIYYHGGIVLHIQRPKPKETKQTVQWNR